MFCQEHYRQTTEKPTKPSVVVADSDFLDLRNLTAPLYINNYQ